MWIDTTGGDQGRDRRKKRRTKFEMRDECRAPKHLSHPLGSRKDMADREDGAKWLKATGHGSGMIQARLIQVKQGKEEAEGGSEGAARLQQRHTQYFYRQ